MRGVDIGGEDAADKPVFGAVGDLDGVILGPAFQNRQDGSEHLGAGNLHVGCHVRDHGWCQEGPGKVQAPPAGGDGGALCCCCLDKPFGPVALRVGNHRAHIRAKLAAVDSRANRQAFGKRHTAIDDLVMDIFVGDHPRHRRADLASVEIDSPAHRFHHRIQIGIRHDDGGRLAPKLEDRRLHIRRRRGGHLDAGLDRSGEDDVADIRMRRQRCPGAVTMATQDIQRAFRKADSLGGARHPDIADRIQLGRFHNTGIAGGNGCRDPARRHLQRIVPGDDLCRHAERLIYGEVQIVTAKRDRPALHCLRLVAVIFEIAGRAIGLDQRFPVGFAGFQRQHPGDLFAVRQKKVTHTAHHPAPLDRAQGCQNTTVMAGLGRRHRAVNIAGVGTGYFGKRLAGPGVLDRQPAGPAINP